MLRGAEVSDEECYLTHYRAPSLRPQARYALYRSSEVLQHGDRWVVS